MAVLSKEIEDKYELLEEIGSGGMGSIYKVRHRLLSEERVIKVMRPQMEQNAEHRERFIREARFAIRLRDQNIAQLYDFSIDEDDTYYIVMEYIRGMNLEEILKSTGPPKISLALEIGRQSLHALGILHHQRFVHRDVSPDNLMLTQDMQGKPLVKLIDLGIAKPLAGEQNLTQTGLFMGKVRYASPEHFGGQNGDSTVEARSDLYSFGVVLYELLTGQYPVSGTNISSLVAGHLFQPPMDFDRADPEGRVPPELRAVVLKSIAKSLDDRFATAEEFSQALRRIQRKYEKLEGAASLAEVGIDTSDVEPESAAFEGVAPPPAEPTTLLPTEERETVVQAPEEMAKAAEAREKEKVASAAKEIGELLEAGSLTLAGRQLERLEKDFQGAEALTELRTRWNALTAQRREEEEAAAKRAEELAAAVQEVGELLEQGTLTLAGQRLEEVEQQYEKTEDLQTLRQRLEVLRAERQREAEEAAKRAAELGAAAREIEQLLQSGDLAAAESALERARQGFPEAEELAALGASLDDRLKEVEKLLAAAQASFDQQDFDESIEQLEKALQLDRSRAVAQQRLSEARSAAKRAQELASAVDTVQSQLASENLKKAERTLAKAERKFPEAEELAALRRRLEETVAERERLAEEERRAEEAAREAESLAAAESGIQGLLERGNLAAAQDALARFEERFQGAQELASLRESLAKQREEVEQLLAEAEKGLELQRYEEAIEYLQRAVQLDSSDEKAKQRLKHTRSVALQVQEQAQAVEAVDKLLREENLKKAERALTKLENKFPEAEELASLRSRLEELKGAAEAEPEDASELLSIDRTILVDQLPEAETPEVAAPATDEAYQPTRIIPLPKPAPVPAPAAAAAEPSVAEAPAEVVEAPRKGLSPRLLAAAAGIVVVAAVALWFVLSGAKTEIDVSPPVAPVADSEGISGPVAGAVGLLTVDALPWAEITRVVDSDGKEHALGGESFTPVVLSLPPGEYTISLANPNFGKPKSVSVVLQPDQSETRLVEFQKVDVDNYFKRAGW